MRFDIPKIVRPLDLGGYDERMNGIVIYVWVNPTRAVLREYGRIRAEGRADDADQVKLDEQLRGWFAEIWSHGPEGTQWSPDELKDLAEADPAFSGWLITETWRMIGEHAAHQKKA